MIKPAPENTPEIPTPHSKIIVVIFSNVQSPFPRVSGFGYNGSGPPVRESRFRIPPGSRDTPMLTPSDFTLSSFCPNRVCPLGAHVDHQHGLITGFAIDRGITFHYSPSETFRLESLNFPGTMKFSLSHVPPRRGNWGDYLRGAVRSLSARYSLKECVTGVFEGSLPVGGLSSSAALIISFLTALCRVNGLTLSPRELIGVAFEAETEYVGVQVGILDQSCEVYSRKNRLLFLDTRDETYDLIPKPKKMPPFEIAVFFSGIERSLTGSAFNVRVDELKAAAYALKGWSGMEYGSFGETRLRDVPVEVYREYRDRLPANWRKRADHYYSEFDRVRKGVKAWRAGDLKEFGELIFESGASSISQYETGSDELKRIYDLMRETPGIYGGRFSGAGFKGCCMALVDPAAKEEIAERITAGYVKTFPHLKENFSVRFCQTADGAMHKNEESASKNGRQ